MSASDKAAPSDLAVSSPLLEQLKRSTEGNQVLMYTSEESLRQTVDEIEKTLAGYTGKLLVGEYVLRDGAYLRVASVLYGPDWLQDRKGSVWVQFGTGGQYLMPHGCSYGGGLDYPVAMEVELATSTRLGDCWIFHAGAGASRGVYFKVPMRVWTCVRDLPVAMFHRYYDDVHAFEEAKLREPLKAPA